MSWNQKLLGWLRKEPDESQSEDLKKAEADEIDEQYSDAKGDEFVDFRLGRKMGDSDR